VIGNHGDQVRARHREHGGLYGPLAEEAGRETDGQTERASSEVKASTADGSDESPARLRSQETSVPTEPGPLSILIWGRPMRIDATWEELFAGRERGASDGKSLVAGSWAGAGRDAVGARREADRQKEPCGALPPRLTPALVSSLLRKWRLVVIGPGARHPALGPTTIFVLRRP